MKWTTLSKLRWELPITDPEMCSETVVFSNSVVSSINIKELSSLLLFSGEWISGGRSLMCITKARVTNFTALGHFFDFNWMGK